jgi:hypothetical protein
LDVDGGNCSVAFVVPWICTTYTWQQQFVVAVVLCAPAGAVYSNKENWKDFAPMGFDGIFRGASVVFFAYLVRPMPGCKCNSTCV